MAKDSAEATSDQPAGAEELRELRQAVLDLGKALKAFGNSRMADIGEDISDEARELADESRRVLKDAETRLAQMEKRAERSMRENPGAWATGLLGVIGFGLVLGLILRRHD